MSLVSTKLYQLMTGDRARRPARKRVVCSMAKREDAATAAAGYEEIVGIDVAFGDDGVDAAVKIVEVVAG